MRSDILTLATGVAGKLGINLFYVYLDGAVTPAGPVRTMMMKVGDTC